MENASVDGQGGGGYGSGGGNNNGASKGSGSESGSDGSINFHNFDPEIEDDSMKTPDYLASNSEETTGGGDANACGCPTPPCPDPKSPYPSFIEPIGDSSQYVGGGDENNPIENSQVEEIDNKINELSKDIKDAHNKHQILESAEKFDRIWVDRMEGGVPGRTAGSAKLQQMYARDSVNKSKERTSLQKEKETLSKSRKSN